MRQRGSGRFHPRNIVLPAAAAAAAAFFVWNIARFFPNQSGHLGYDYGMFLPWLIAGFFWQSANGPLPPPDFVPSFCGGIPFLFNPQSLYYSLPQWLVAWFQPVQALLIAWITFGLAGGLGMYALLRRALLVSPAAALLGAVIFLLNGFYTTRMLIGHVTYHGVMLLPAIAITLFLPPSHVPRLAAIAVRAVLAGLLLAYLFYSGGTNTILPMILALAILALILRHTGRWHRDLPTIAAAGCLIGIGLCAYKLLPALAFAANVVRPVALRMSDHLLSLIAGAFVSLFVPQALSHLGPARLVVDRVELEYGVGIVPLLVLPAAAWITLRRGSPSRRLTLLGILLLLAVPILVNFDGLGLRWLVLHLPVVRSMSVMLRFWFAYIPVLCVLTAVAFDQLIPNSQHRARWSAAAIALTIVQCSATDMGYYAEQPYDPAPLAAAYAKIHTGGAVPPITRVDDPWALNGQLPGASRDDALVDGISAFPCYEPMFGYRMQVFKQGRLAPGAALEPRDGRLNLKNPACYVFPGANGCAPGDEFSVTQTPQAKAFAAYHPYPYEWPAWQYLAAVVTMASAALCIAVLLTLVPYLASIRLRTH